MTRHNITASDEDWQALKELGSGNASEGIRVALRKSQERDLLIDALSGLALQEKEQGK